MSKLMRFPEFLHHLHKHAKSKRGACLRRAARVAAEGFVAPTAEVTEKLMEIISEGEAHSLGSEAEMHAAADEYLAGLKTEAAGRSDAARYVEALLVLEAFDHSSVARSVADVLIGAKTGKVTQAAVEKARRIIADVSVDLQVSALSPWAPEMTEYRAGLKELLRNEVEDGRKRVEERAAQLRVCRLNMQRGATASTNAAKTRVYAPAISCVCRWLNLALTRFPCHGVNAGRSTSNILRTRWSSWRRQWRRLRRWTTRRRHRRSTRRQEAAYLPAASHGALALQACSQPRRSCCSAFTARAPC